MQFTILIAALSASVAVAMPGRISQRQTTICSGTYSNEQCCATNVLNLADLDCADPSTTPANSTDFISICEATGLTAYCCALPILEQALLCNEVTPDA